MGFSMCVTTCSALEKISFFHSITKTDLLSVDLLSFEPIVTFKSDEEQSISKLSTSLKVAVESANFGSNLRTHILNPRVFSVIIAKKLRPKSSLKRELFKQEDEWSGFSCEDHLEDLVFSIFCLILASCLSANICFSKTTTQKLSGLLPSCQFHL